MTADQQNVVDQWTYSQTQLALWKAHEAKLRVLAVGILGSADKIEGSETITLDDGRRAVVEKKLNYKLRNDNGEIFQLRAAGLPEEMFVALFPVSYKLNESAYRKLTPAQQQWIAAAVEINPGLPSLTLKPPAEDKVIR
jgi:hypothetical protein